MRWTTAKPEATHLQYGYGQFDQIVQHAELRTEHEAVLTGLQRPHEYQYRIGQQHSGTMHFTKPFLCDTFFHYTPIAAFCDTDPGRAEPESPVERILADRRSRTGMCLVTGHADADTLLRYCRLGQMRFVVVDTDAERVIQLRETLRAKGVYGHQVSVHHVRDTAALPFVANWADLAVAVAPDSMVTREVKRMLRPDGGTALLLNPEPGMPIDDAELLGDGDSDRWYRHVRGALPGVGDWSHLYGTPDNSVFCG
ncbi:MAG: class I SAM-dependent methyltransferase [Fuerstiella sp.]